MIADEPEWVVKKSPMRRMVDHLGNLLTFTRQGKMRVTDGVVEESDVQLEYSDTSNWIDYDAAGYPVGVIPFIDLHTAIRNDSADNPKVLLIHFESTIFFNQVGMGCAVHPGESFSNVKCF